MRPSWWTITAPCTDGRDTPTRGGMGWIRSKEGCTGASGAGPIGARGRRGGMAEVGSPLDTENLQDYF